MIQMLNKKPETRHAHAPRSVCDARRKVPSPIDTHSAHQQDEEHFHVKELDSCCWGGGCAGHLGNHDVETLSLNTDGSPVYAEIY